MRIECLALAALVATSLGCGTSGAASQPVLTGTAAYGGWKNSAPGVTRLIRPQDMPPPYATRSVSNGPKLVPRPAGANLKVPPGFEVRAWARGFDGPRQMKLAPNGDVFLAESNAKQIRVLRQGPGRSAPVASVFAAGLRYRPYGIAFYPPGPDPTYIYIGTEGEVLRFPYHRGDLKAAGNPELVVGDIPVGHHWTRDIAFSPDGRRLLVAVGSADNDGEKGMAIEARRADILDYDPQGRDLHIYASGIRNPVTIAFYPGTDTLWAAVNERDGLGDNLPPDYVTRVKPGGFYGWPWFYIGGHQDPRHAGQRADLSHRVDVPDVLIQPHAAALGLVVYTGAAFPAADRGSVFVALHGSWNRAPRTGYEIVRLPVTDGKPTGAYEDFLTGFVTPKGDVWGRPVELVVTADGALLMSDDASGTIWRIAYTGGRPANSAPAAVR